MVKYVIGIRLCFVGYKMVAPISLLTFLRLCRGVSIMHEHRKSCGIEHTVCCINEEKKSQLWWIFYPCLIGNNVLKDLLSVVFADKISLNTGTWILNLSVLQTHYTHIP